MRGVLVFHQIRAVILALALTGCATSLDLGRATTLQPGEDRFSAGTHSTLISPSLTPQSDTTVPWLQLETGWHRGLAPGVEVGTRVWGMGWPGLFTTAGVAADAKFQLGRGVVDVALAPTLLYYRPAFGGAPWHIGSAQTTLLIGVNLGPHQLIVSPRAAGWAWGGYGQAPQAALSGGLGIGVAIDLGVLDLTPELAWGWSPIAFDGEVKSEGRRGLDGTELGVTISYHPARGSGVQTTATETTPVQP